MGPLPYAVRSPGASALRPRERFNQMHPVQAAESLAVAALVMALAPLAALVAVRWLIVAVAAATARPPRRP